MNILTINEQRIKLKDWCFKMPNFSYCHRYVQVHRPKTNKSKI